LCTLAGQIEDSSIKFQEYLSSGSRVVPYERKDKHEANSRFWQFCERALQRYLTQITHMVAQAAQVGIEVAMTWSCIYSCKQHMRRSVSCYPWRVISLTYENSVVATKPPDNQICLTKRSGVTWQKGTATRVHRTGIPHGTFTLKNHSWAVVLIRPHIITRAGHHVHGTWRHETQALSLDRDSRIPGGSAQFVMSASRNMPSSWMKCKATEWIAI